jgi:hypothetical protein
VLILVDFKSSTINRSERWNVSETYGESLKVLLEDSRRGKERWLGRFGGIFGDGDVLLEDTPYDSTSSNLMSMYIYELFESNGWKRPSFIRAVAG